MKTNNQKWLVRLCNYLLIFIFCTGMFHCSKKKDGPGLAIKAEQAKLIATDVNGCKLSSGLDGTEFDIAIIYTMAPGMTIEKIEFSSAFSNGNKTDGEFSVGGDGTDGSVETWACIRFGSATWNERSYTLVATNGEKSNPVKLTLNKPPGAH